MNLDKTKALPQVNQVQTPIANILPTNNTPIQSNKQSKKPYLKPSQPPSTRPIRQDQPIR
ncbi:hypothetical protein BDW42DRAFT_167839 [Aspergillus taichungensis]|uniref:Uncharacterized protein n=1 Tax=Aspergillus taichungensis TaxID=482145 RepID=A0A2J5HX37_9EURO|nr:hypothetical protein BDW42DRAFT_167839 [Aspergillus taichungensis]